MHFENTYPQLYNA